MDWFLGGKFYNGFKIGYKNGVGDAEKDEYIVLYHKDNSMMEWLLYTVTYFDEPSPQNGANQHKKRATPIWSDPFLR